MAGGGLDGERVLDLLLQLELMLASLALTDHCLHVLLCLLVVIGADRGEERLKVEVEIFFVDPHVPIEQEQKLLLHEVDLCGGEAEGVEARHCSVASPVLVLGRRVVEILRSEDERGQEDAVNGATHALCHWG